MPQSTSPPIRIAYLVNQYPKVSHTFIRREIEALERQGVAIERIAFRGWDGEVVDAADGRERNQTHYTLKGGLPGLMAGLATEAFRTPRIFWRALMAAFVMARPSARPWPYHLVYLAHACRIRRWLRASPVDHLHAHFGTNPAEVAHLLHLLGGPRYSFTVHGPDEVDDAKRLSFERTIGRAAFVAAISSYTRSQLMRRVSATHWDKIKVVHCGLPETAFATTPTPLPAEPRLLCIGRLSGQKGHGVLLDAMAEVLKSVPDASLVLAGDGEMRAEIEAQIDRLGIRHSVRITGWIGEDQVRRELEGARVLVQPSFMEGLPVVIMEAMARFRPVISTYVAGIPELVRPAENGWLVPAGDIETLANAMLEALRCDANTLERMGQAGHKNVRARHNVDTEAAKLRAFFES